MLNQHLHANKLAPSPFPVTVTRDVVYGHGGIDFTSDRSERPLKLDVYAPVVKEKDCDLPRPAIILAFGGAFHRGSKEDDSFCVGEGTNTATSWYAHYWASQGFITFCIDYRLIPEDPAPGSTPVLSSAAAVGSPRMHAIREKMGLPPLDDARLAHGVEAGADDMAAAARYVYANAKQWNVDPARVVLWGWSAGARNALHAVFSEGIHAAAVIALSPYIHDDTLKQMLKEPQQGPALLLAYAQRDMPHIREQAEPMAAFFEAFLPVVEVIEVLDIDHFYPAESTVKARDGDSGTLLNAMDDFLYRQIGSTD